MSGYTTHQGTIYYYTAGILCGVFVTEKVMRKLAGLQERHLEAVKHLLSDEAERGNVHPSMWTLHYPDGKQTQVNFIDTSVDVQQRIKNAVTACQPEACKLVFIASCMDEARQMADARHAVMNGGAA